jgi:hypothetical protein
MKTMVIDSDDGILQYIPGAAIMAVPLAFILGWQMIAFGLPALVFPWALGKAVRMGDLARTPFSFCLPGFRESLRRRCFLAGTLTGAAMLLFPATFYVSMRFEGLSHNPRPVETCLSMAAAFGVGMVIALIVGSMRFVLSRREKNWIFLLSIPLFLGAVVAFSAFIEYAFVGIPFCAAACLFVWFRLGDMRRVGEGHRAILTGAWEERMEQDASKAPSSQGEYSSLTWMELRWRLPERSRVGKGLYAVFAPIVRYKTWILISVVAAILVMGFAGRWFREVLFLASGLLVLGAPLPIPFDGLWLPLGRRERGLATIAVVVAVFLLLEGGAAVVSVGTWVLAALFSAFDISWYTGIAGSDLCLPGVLVPWLVGWRLLRVRRPRVARVIGSVLGIIETGVLVLMIAKGASSVRSVGAVFLAPALIGGWPVFLLALWDVCTRGDLIEPSGGTGD